MAHPLIIRRSSSIINYISSIGYMISGLPGIGVPSFVNVVWSLIAESPGRGELLGEGATTLEWTLSSPPPFHSSSRRCRSTVGDGQPFPLLPPVPSLLR